MSTAIKDYYNPYQFYMKTKTINLYTINELQELDGKGYDNAIKYFRDNNEYFFLADCMSQELHELLEEKGIKDLNDTSKPGTTPTPVLYSLSSCQGDGVCFEGEFEYKDITINITHTGRYYHYNSVNIEAQETKNLGFHIDETEPLYKQEQEFIQLYQDICKELEAYGYSFIESEDSEDNIKDNCEVNEYYFTIDGVLTSE